MLTVVSEWRPMAARDIGEVDAIAQIVHPDYPEDVAVLKERLALFPAGCFVAESDDGLLGYAISHPSILGKPAELNSLLGHLPREANCLFLHDVALTERSRGLGLGRSLVERLAAIAKREKLSRVALVSVNNSRGYWKAQGFEEYAGDAALAAKLASYGEDAAYMTLTL